MAAGVPPRLGDAPRREVRAQFVMPAHFLTVAAITVAAVGLGLATEYPGGHAPPGGLWLAATGLTIYLVMSTVLHARPRSWPLGFLIAGGLAAVVGVQIAYLDRYARPSPDPIDTG